MTPPTAYLYYIFVPYYSFSPSRRLTTRPHYLLILISRTFLSRGVSLVLYIAPICGPIMSTNATCFTPKAPEKGPSLFQHGKVVFQGMCNVLSVYPHVFLDHGLIVRLYGWDIVAHNVGWIISGFFTVIAIVASFWLINKHLQWYTNVRPFSARL